MNENLNLIEILKDCPKGTKLYSTVYGEVDFDGIRNGSEYPVKYVKSSGSPGSVTAQGLVLAFYDGECTLFPSREERDWSKFKPKKNRFDPKILQPFDRVLVKVGSYWRIEWFSHMYEYKGDIYYVCSMSNYKECIPYNDETKRLLGTSDEAPEYYRYWED